MANLKDDWPEDYRRKIEEIETKLNREICGAPDADGEPCQKWPIDSEQGRCREHHNAPNNVVPDQTSENAGAVEEVGNDTDQKRAFFPTYFLILAFCGLLAGAGSVLVWYHFNLVGFVRQKFSHSGNINTRAKEKKTAAVNPDEPDFFRLRELARRGEVDRMVASLRKIAAESDKAPIRAEANYQLFVFYQHQEEFERALDVADKFLGNFAGSRRAAEVLYGAGYICERYLEDSTRAREYYDTLKGEYPDSKWAEKVS